MAEEGRKCTGIVKWFSGQKGFGFIAPDEGGEDLFVHQTEIKAEGFRTLREGKRVEFVVHLGEDGRSKAGEVVVLPRAVRAREARGGRGGGRRGFGGGRRGGSFAGDGGSGGAECYNCGGIGHLARDCIGVSDGSGNRWHGGRRGGGRGGRGRGRGGGGSGGSRCYNCGEEGHFARDCVNEQK